MTLVTHFSSHPTLLKEQRHFLFNLKELRTQLVLINGRYDAVTNNY